MISQSHITTTYHNYNHIGPAFGGDMDEHGCYISAGYDWCEATQSCYRWCEATIGGDHDAFGYSTTAGYGWCSATNKCCRPWEDTCSSIGSVIVEHGCFLSA
eukprot:418787_1